MIKMYIFIIFLLVLIIVYLVYIRPICTTDEKNIKTLIRQASRWSNASQQDSSPLVSVLHANYGAGYLWALRDLYTDDQIYKSSGINIIALQNKITDIQDRSTKNMIKVYPEYGKNLDVELAKLGGEI